MSATLRRGASRLPIVRVESPFRTAAPVCLNVFVGKFA